MVVKVGRYVCQHIKAGANGSNMLDTTCWMLDATCWNRLFAYYLFIYFFLFGTRKFDFFFIINTLLASFFLCKMDEHEVVNVDEVESRKKRKIAVAKKRIVSARRSDGEMTAWPPITRWGVISASIIFKISFIVENFMRNISVKLSVSSNRSFQTILAKYPFSSLRLIHLRVFPRVRFGLVSSTESRSSKTMSALATFAAAMLKRNVKYLLFYTMLDEKPTKRSQHSNYTINVG